MIAINSVRMPEECSVCFACFRGCCRLDEDSRIVVPALPDESSEGRPEWCPLVDVPDMNVGNSSEIPNNSDCVSKRAAVEAIANQSRFSAEEIINICDKSVQDENGWLGGLKEAILAVLELPSSQPEIILCKDCIHRWHSGGRSVAGKWIRIYRCKRNGIEINLNDFCSYAERKKDGSD